MAEDRQKNTTKGFKITNASHTRLIGVACSSLEELKRKACQKLQISSDRSTIEVLLYDGTSVDDESYFQTLPNQTVVVLRKPGEKVLDGVDIIYGALKSFNAKLLETPSMVRQFFDDDTRTKIKLLSQFLQKDVDTKKALLSSKDDDPEWFEDLETVATTKEEYMRRRSCGRIQRYFYDAKDKVKNSYLYLNNPLARRIFEDVFDNFYHRLRRDEFFAQYFDRTANNGAMCDTDGVFLCEGIWNSDSCKYGAGDSQSEHRINPYINKEQRIVFATWNLDHRVERSRTIIPSMVNASEICCRDANIRVNWPYFYDLFFSRQNLKLVHIVCHDKGEHKTAVCDENKIVLKESHKYKRNNIYSRGNLNKYSRYNKYWLNKRPKRLASGKN